jgi:excisionase family DNA binding protein
MVLMSTRQAAERIGVSDRQVQRLVASGALMAIGPDRVDAESVEQWLAQRRSGRVRAWEEPTAWAAVALLERSSAPWLGQAQRSRLHSGLATMTSTELATRTRNRARVRRYFAHPQALSHLARSVIPSGALTELGGLTPRGDRVDGYVAGDALLRLVTRFRLERDPAGSVILRETSMPDDVVSSLADGQRHVLAGLDLAGSVDERERSAGHRILDHALAKLRG